MGAGFVRPHKGGSMRKYFSLPALAFFLTFNANAQDRENGKVNMAGEIIESACTIATNDIWQEVDFGEISLARIADKNSNIEKNFTLHLINCRLERDNGVLWNNAAITFDGQIDDNDESMFSMAGEGGGVAFRIADNEGHYAHSGEAMPPVPLHEKENALDYKIRLVKNNEPLSAGNALSFVRFMISYQ